MSERSGAFAAHQIATKAAGGSVGVVILRDPIDGPRFAVSYESRATHWLCRHRFQDIAQADAGALTLSDFLGAEVR